MSDSYPGAPAAAAAPASSRAARSTSRTAAARRSRAETTGVDSRRRRPQARPAHRRRRRRAGRRSRAPGRRAVLRPGPTRGGAAGDHHRVPQHRPRPGGAQKIDALRTLNKFPAFKDELDVDSRRRHPPEVSSRSSTCPRVCRIVDDEDIEPWLGERLAVAAVDTGAKDSRASSSSSRSRTPTLPRRVSPRSRTATSTTSRGLWGRG